MKEVSTSLIQYLDFMGISGEESRRKFLFPELTDHHDPFMLVGMEQAVALISSAVKAKKKILIWGDADLDGISSTALLKSCLEDLGAQTVEIRIPGRDSEGFGLIGSEIEEFADGGGELIITVDVGITNVDEARIAKESGLDLVITDHHEVLGEIPETVVVNPKFPADNYPFRELAGAGVTFKLVTGLYQKMVGLSVQELVKLRPHYWIFAALGTVSDRCPLVDENRLIVKKGLEHLKLQGWPSLSIWLQEMGLDVANLSVFDLYSRGISPFYADAPEGIVELLLSDDREWARTRFRELREMAESWQRGKQWMIDEAESSARHIGNIVVIVSEAIGHDYLGTVAHSLRERHAKPVIVLVPKADTWHAECRGLEETDILAYLATFHEYYTTFGGHRKACGFTLKPGKLDEFLQAVESNPIQSCEKVQNENESSFELDVKTDFADWTLLAPFGEGNPPPVLYARNINILKDIDGFSAEGVNLYIPLALRPVTYSNGHFNMKYTINADGRLRVLDLKPVEKKLPES